MKEKRRGSPKRIVPSLRWEAGITSESLKPITMAGMLRRRLVRGPATPVSKRVFRDETVLSIRITAPSVPKGEKGKGKKKGSVALIPYFWDTK
jgi:hypothetical protein